MLRYSQDSTLLGILCKEADYQVFAIFLRSNYHWYVKYAIKIEKESPVVNFIWMFQKKTQLFMVHENGDFFFKDFLLSYHTSSSNYNFGKNDLGYTAVVNNRTIQLTPLGKLLMPPPMSEKELNLPSFPNLICLYSHKLFALMKEKNQIATADCSDISNTLTFFDLDFDTNRCFKILAKENSIFLIESGKLCDKIIQI